MTSALIISVTVRVVINSSGHVCWVARRWAGLVPGLVTVYEYTLYVFNQAPVTPTPTQPGQPWVDWIMQWIKVCMGNSPQSYGMSAAIWDHTVLPVTSERAPPLPEPVSRYSVYLPQRDGRLSWPRATRQCTGREPNSRSLDHKSDALTTTPPSRPRLVLQ